MGRRRYPADITQAAKKYRAWLGANTHVGEDTASAYVSAVTRFLNKMRQQGVATLDIEPGMVDAYLDAYAGRSSLLLKRTALGHYLAMLVEAGVLEEDTVAGLPVTRDRKPKNPYHHPANILISQIDYERFILKEASTRTFRSARKALVAHILYHVGITVEECAQLDISDLHLVERVVIVGYETVPMPACVRETALDYLTRRAGLVKARYEPSLFVTVWGRRPSPTTLAKDVKDLVLQSGVDPRIHARMVLAAGQTARARRLFNPNMPDQLVPPEDVDGSTFEDRVHQL